ncbi:hypothetical protein acsn021_03060 [Anaerocolumna cellulosilytica]|uniref:Uncharacterized protein n=1 Tax=Anaerocolumna cellulosilytica TaxID=433286 RepID=A0A6S6QXY6_9FIRM|nr:hypothetical protein acsn021_03060 [Anaerocolumna cellulosilytica]
MKKFIVKFRYYLALLFIITTISSVSPLFSLNTTSDGIFTTANDGGKWMFEYR